MTRAAGTITRTCLRILHLHWSALDGAQATQDDPAPRALGTLVADQSFRSDQARRRPGCGSVAGGAAYWANASRLPRRLDPAAKLKMLRAIEDVSAAARAS